MAISPFEFVNAITYSKDRRVFEESTVKDYVPFVANRALSYFADTVLYANEVNRYSLIAPGLQLEYLFDTIPKRKRFSKWSKKIVPTASHLAICKVFGVSHSKAEDIMQLLSDSELEAIVMEAVF